MGVLRRHDFHGCHLRSVPVSTQVSEVAAVADGVVVGSAIINTVGSVPADASTEARAEKLKVCLRPFAFLPEAFFY